MKKGFFLIVILLLVSSCYKTSRVQEIKENQSIYSIKPTTVYLVTDTIELPPNAIPVKFYLSKKDSLYIDSIQKSKFKRVTKRVNGGYIGWDLRLKEWERIKKILNKQMR